MLDEYRSVQPCPRVGGARLQRILASTCDKLFPWDERPVRGLPRARGAVAERSNFPRGTRTSTPVNEGHDYVLNAIPQNIWARAKRRANVEERSVRVVLVRALDLYGAGRLDL
jgi:hypothetical protein